MRKWIKMKAHDEVTISFNDDNSVTVMHNNFRHAPRKHEFDSFDDGASFFKEMIGTLYLDGYR